MDKIKLYFKALVVASIITIIILLISAAVLTYTNIPDNMINVMTFVAIITSVFISSYIVSKRMKTKGIIYGGVFGLIYFLTIYLLTVFNGGIFSININTLIYLAVCVGVGGVAGVIGVNR